MYTPEKFNQKDFSQVVELIQNQPLATLVCQTADGLEATHLPFVIEKTTESEPVNTADYNGETRLLLKSHIAIANQLWKTVRDDAGVLLIFQGPHCYISPNYYATKQEHGKVVPTWNYISVHLNGKIRFITDSSWKLAMLNQLTKHNEKEQNRLGFSPWNVKDAPQDFVEKQMQGIVGIEVDVNRIQAKWKMSQNQPVNNQQGVVSALNRSAVAAEKSVAGIIGQSLAGQQDATNKNTKN